ncbi:energy-coupling factor ABC transporter ATP-binding protein [Micromonospora yasonensis]|uniref:energy-coupling factor ABC transporter ATP-binding protein n=1 Tax=Micromonospora yasonensis TaxID=1128667 RepID=UPI0022324B0D|nr:ABC transporter ATP-binding protein [Micromonospora yasonensis]MCW3842763.1 energy-coupling factor ABC transporter ATP-binding protein [Micromonospora yasonensis]
MDLATLRDVTFTYAYAEMPALEGVTLQLQRGQLYGVVGINGSGKSTLCSLLRGLIPHFHQGTLEGTVEILGKDLGEWDAAELSRTIGCVFDNPFTQISGIKDTVFEEIAFGLENLGVSRSDMLDRVTSVSEQMGITALLRKNPNELSGGQRQKVAFASIIAMDSEVLVIDEPTSQLDPQSSHAVFEIIADLKARGKSIVLVEHKIDLMAQFADRLVVMRSGEVVAEGPTAQVLASPAMDAADVPRPEVTDLAFALEAVGKGLGCVPVTRREAEAAIATRMRGTQIHADRVA